MTTRGSRYPVPEIHTAVLPELGDGSPRRGVDRHEKSVASRPHDTGLAVVLPICHTAMPPTRDRRGTGLIRPWIVNPQRPTGPGVDRRGLIQWGAHEQHPIHH